MLYCNDIPFHAFIFLRIRSFIISMQKSPANKPIKPLKYYFSYAFFALKRPTDIYFNIKKEIYKKNKIILVFPGAMCYYCIWFKTMLPKDLSI